MVDAVRRLDDGTADADGRSMDTRRADALVTVLGGSTLDIRL